MEFGQWFVKSYKSVTSYFDNENMYTYVMDYEMNF